MQQQFKVLLATGTLFKVEPDRDLIWQTYLQAIPEEFRQANTCNCCKSFLRQFGGIVGLKDNKIVSLWDLDLGENPEYSGAIAAVRRYVHSLPISGPFFNPFPKCGTDRNPDKVRGVVWEHFFVEIPRANVKSEENTGPFVAVARDDQSVLLRSINEITTDAVQTVLDLIGQGSIYRGAEFQGVVTGFQKVQKAGLKVPAGLRGNFCWTESTKIGGAACRIRNTSIGTLLVNLSEGMELDHAVRAFEVVVAPSNYKRPTALVTPAMIKKAQERLEELGLTGALKRRLLTDRDLTANNALHVYRPKNKSKDIFAQLAEETLVNPKSLSRVDEISIDDFLANVLPTAKSVKVLIENSHFPNFVSLVGPQDPAGPTMLKWGNDFSWSYSGEVADSIRQRVKDAGGNVEGVIRVSLSWNNIDDLDLHVIEAGGYHTYYRTKRTKSPSGSILDVDANGGDGIRDNPVENIYWKNLPTQYGEFEIYVQQYSKRADDNSGFEVEIEHDGETFNFPFADNGITGRKHPVATFTYTRSGGFQIRAASKTGSYKSREKWGVKTGTFVPVRAITLSPNHWDTPTGNKHTFFLLEGCKADEKVRGFYNEFLKPELDADRKVFEILGSKVEVEETPNPLCGLGFSETVRNHLIVEVEGSHKRQLKIKF